MKLLIAGGGTGGHLFPAIATARAWRNRFGEESVLLVGADRPLDRKLLTDSGLPHRLIRAGGLKGKTAGERVRSMALLGAGVLQALAVLLRFRPYVVLGTGGYVSAPAVMAAWILHRPIVLMEQNVQPGAANRWLSRFARAVALGFPEARGAFAPHLGVDTGIPLRPEIEALAGAERPDPAAEGRRTLLIFGGSQGAQAINEAVCRALPAWKKGPSDFRVIHVTGERDLERVRRAYGECGIEAEVTPFLTDMASAYRRADLAVTRAGALTVLELMMAGVPALLIPLPTGTDRHQEANAAAAGPAARVIPQRELETRLVPDVEHLLGDPARLRAMSREGRARVKPGAVLRILDLCMSTARGERTLDRHPH